ncbi:protein 5NUC-like [Macrosteles quadrilineatus]|uniref:protein 5NUC-like n=1 Tax=Macrosteles quadrilineatus TaxID=74068 RepID=UPI0023E26607|nr:protein 5NUC-like [Macrosteles quadrilineatus]XP_054262338.1 protein 5NUC-like [Macrosteles quadrilineatus]XP_054262339.1 protein 5NUC-like [Macrosteles quadrilineatus]XP_054262340.1 protein 5NUC-like [Macrosteles quadrilineatus]XP_054262342.1 protein 5NUC-like [Macrosteles quadrilineatus]XP_054262343.1 protein 5NUC-like [Macrosteles quadrilineatus]
MTQLLQTILLSATLAMVNCEFKLLLLHTNDMHARFEETNAHSGLCYKGRGRCYGGFARLKTAVNQYKQQAKKESYNTIFLNAGDTYQGTVFFTLFKAGIVSELTNMLGIDVMSLGNHEFDDGPEGLTPFLKKTLVPVVCSNIDDSSEPQLEVSTLSPSRVLDINGVKVGVIGYLTPDTKFLAKTRNVKFEDEIVAIKRESEKLKSKGVKILIALGHSGYNTDKKIAEQVPDLDVVVGGHTNTFLYNGKVPDSDQSEGPYPTLVKQDSGRNVLVVQAYAYTKYLGHLKLTFDDEGEVLHSEGNPILLDDTFKKDGEIERAVLKYANEVKELAGRKIGSSKTFLEADHASCRLRECNFANLLTDAMVQMNAQDFTGEGWTDAPIAFIQGGSFRSSIDTVLSRGEITYSDLLTTLPFQNSVEKLLISGEILRQVLEHSVEWYDPVERVGAFMQFSGVYVKYDLSKPVGQRVVSALIRCGDCGVPHYLPLDTSKQYMVLTNTFLADGGDGYSMLKEATERTALAYTDVGALESFIKDRSPVHPEIEGRITFEPNGTPNTASSTSLNLLTAILCLSTLSMFSSLLSK